MSTEPVSLRTEYVPPTQKYHGRIASGWSPERPPYQEVVDEFAESTNAAFYAPQEFPTDPRPYLAAIKDMYAMGMMILAVADEPVVVFGDYTIPLYSRGFEEFAAYLDQQVFRNWPSHLLIENIRQGLESPCMTGERIRV